jgi:hypothetical protein
MMDYFEAKRAERLFREYRSLALSYWRAKPQDSRDRLAVAHKVDPPESAESRGLREEINLHFPDVYNNATHLGVGVNWVSYPPPAVGGPAVPVNLLLSVVDQEMGHGRISRQKVLDVIDRCIGAAELAKRSALKRIFLPWYWVIDLPAVLIRVPFLILRRAGLPPSVEENIISHVIKVIFLIALMGAMAYFGYRMTVADAVKLLMK